LWTQWAKSDSSPVQPRFLVDVDIRLVEAVADLADLVGVLVQVGLDRQVEPPGQVARAFEQVLRAGEGEARRDREALLLRVPLPGELLGLLEHAGAAIRADVHERRPDPGVDPGVAGGLEAGVDRLGPRRGVERGGGRPVGEHLLEEPPGQLDRAASLEFRLDRVDPLSEPVEQAVRMDAADGKLRHVAWVSTNPGMMRLGRRSKSCFRPRPTAEIIPSRTSIVPSGSSAQPPLRRGVRRWPR
jgi:hypothetical protein